MPYTERKAASLASFSMHLSSLGLVNLKMLPQKYSRSRKDLLLLSTQPQLITTTTDKVRYLVLFVLRSSFKNLLKKQKKLKIPIKPIACGQIASTSLFPNFIQSPAFVPTTLPPPPPSSHILSFQFRSCTALSQRTLTVFYPLQRQLDLRYDKIIRCDHLIAISKSHVCPQLEFHTALKTNAIYPESYLLNMSAAVTAGSVDQLASEFSNASLNGGGGGRVVGTKAGDCMKLGKSEVDAI